ncbi:MAG: aminotransferase class III-fold pyridoxal phosphate-dependent enzyme, partial [Gammaproteobacteria bacterium]|nr:aminotransferase class III-fold pyridoxal phosphate-dependent enzyme [Gammaproteobacteria bacterium]
GHPTACAAALAVQRIIERDKLLANVRTQGAALQAALERRFGQHAHIGDIRGRGLFIGLEIVADRETKAPFDPALAVHQSLKRHAMQAGLICYPMSGTLDGRLGHHVLLAPPYIINAEHVTEIVDKLDLAMHETGKELGFAR